VTGGLPCPGATAGEPPVITLAVGVGDWLGDGAVAAGGAAVVGGGATGTAVVGAGTGTDEM
jgi:hypothetical protein